MWAGLIKGACLAKFGGMKKLQYINLSSNDIEPKWLTFLIALPLLQEVWLEPVVFARQRSGELDKIERAKTVESSR